MNEGQERTDFESAIEGEKIKKIIKIAKPIKILISPIKELIPFILLNIKVKKSITGMIETKFTIIA